jgi:hypothetical protein
MTWRRFECAICGEERLSSKNRFLLAENRWEDKLTVLHWDEELVSREGMQSACSISHVEELVVHWMATTGSLDYPFARTTLGSGWRQRPYSRVDITGGSPISELAVHRESVERLLTENPQSLQGMLDGLREALQLETMGDEIQVQEQGQDEEAFVVSFKS